MYEEEVAKKSKVEREREREGEREVRGGVNWYHFLHLCIFSSSNYLLRFGLTLRSSSFVELNKRCSLT